MSLTTCLKGLLIGALFFGCSGTTPEPEYPEAEGGRPDWVDGRARRYADADYLLGVGRGTTRAACENDALAALAKRFSAHIQQASKDWMGHISEVNEGGEQRVEAMRIDQLTQVSTDYVLRGARIAERWEEDVEVVHCLAVLERQPAARSLLSEIQRLDAEIAAYVSEGDKAEQPAAKFITYGKAMALLQRREALNAELRVVQAAGRGRPAPIGWADLVGKFNEARARVKIGLALQGGEAAAIQSCLAAELTRQGIEVREGRSDVDLMVQGDVDVQRAGEVGGVVMVRMSIALRLLDVAEGTTLASLRESVKAGRKQYPQSVQLVTERLCNETSAKLVAEIRDALGK